MSYYTTKNWKARTGEGLNKYSIDGATPVTIINSPDSITQVGDALSATNLNNLEGRINDGFNNVETAVSGLSSGVTFKGEVAATTDLPEASSSNIGWEYWVVNEAAFYISDGTTWVAVDATVLDELTSTSATKALSANQGRVLDEIKVDKDTFNALGLSVVSGAINITYTE